jgi:hypothetical protein
MSSGAVQREVSADGEVTLTAGRCTFAFRRLAPDALLITIRGYDAGQFGASTLDEIRMELLRNRPIDVFVDARDAVGAAVGVSDEWTRFFALNREHLRRVRVLVGSPIVQLTVAIAQHLSRTGDLIEIHSEPATFAASLDSHQRAGARQR